MLGLIGAVAFGAVFAGSWMVAEDREQTSRSNCKKDGRSLYIDKNGNFRHTNTKKKYSTDDAIRSIEKFNKEREEKKNRYTPRYWGFERCAVYKANNKIMIDSYGSLTNIIPIIELYDDYDKCKQDYEVLKKEYLEEGVSSYDILMYNAIKNYSESEIDNYKYHKFIINKN